MVAEQPTPFEHLAAAARRYPSSAAARGARIAPAQILGGKVYHGSLTELQPGDRVVPGWPSSHAASPSSSICVTSAVDLALYWAQLGGYGKAYVYEVVPEGLIDVWRCSLDTDRQMVRLQEGRVRSARIVAVAAAEAPWQRPAAPEAPQRRRLWSWVLRLLGA